MAARITRLGSVAMESFRSAIGMGNIALLPVAVKLLMAVLCGGVLGLERTYKRRAAGIRTYSMVCLGAAVVMMTGVAMAGVGGDPSRMGAQVVSGIGFIGAGAIIVTGYHEIKGLTTAAGLWASACMGLTIGAGYYTVALLACAALFCIVHYGERLQSKMFAASHRVSFYVMFENSDHIAGFLMEARARRIAISDLEHMGAAANGGKPGAVFALKLPRELTQQQAHDLFSRMPGVLYIETI